jgi:hypothetical protein
VTKPRRSQLAGYRRWLPVLPLLFGAACGGPQDLGDAGSTCFRDDDCQPGLICVAPPMNPANRLCSSDPSSLVSNVDGPPPVAMGGDMALAGSAGAALAGGGMAPVAGGGAGGSAPSAGSNSGGSESGGSESGGTNVGGSSAAGTGAGGSGGSSTAGSEPGGSGGVAGSGGTAPEGGAM